MTWAQVLVLGALVLGTGPAARAQDTPQKMQKVVVDGDPVAPLPTGALIKGAGLCAAFRPTDSVTASNTFPSRPADFPNEGVAGKNSFSLAVNDFMDAGATGPLPSTLYATLQTPFDLTNTIQLTDQGSDGDYVMSACYPPNHGGCLFPGPPPGSTLPEQAFGSRFRGFIAVPENWVVAQTVQFGFVSDDAVAMRIFAKGKPNETPPIYEVVSRAVEPVSSTYRVTNQVTFQKPGLYPIEILYVNYGKSAFLEMAVMFNPSFSEIDEYVFKQDGLPKRGFLLTQPEIFFQTSSGVLPFAGAPATCQQCPRMWANQPNQPQNICPAGMFCNEAAVCSPCVGDQFCGTQCKQCAKPDPYCARDPASAGADYTCVECRDDPDCQTGQKCIKSIGKCISPCACCGDTPFCLATDPLQPAARNCSACRNDDDCPGGQCDLLNGRCVDKLPDCNTDDKCGALCVNCITSTLADPQGARPHCLDGQVCGQCRNDVDCTAGTYCRSGDCLPCTHDRHCGPSCLSCGIEIVGVAADGSATTTLSATPFCAAPNGKVPTAVCVRCLTDDQCGPGGTCDPATNQCSPAAPCVPPCSGKTVCDGTACVECFTAAQCPCGQCIAGSCTNNCGDSTDCRSNQCCAQETGQCADGRCKPGLTANGGALCCSAPGGAVGGPTDPAVPTRSRRPLWSLLAALGLLAAWRLRSLRGAHKPEPAQRERE